MHHFGEVAAAHQAGQHQAGIAFRLECFENRTRGLEIILVTTHHERIPAVDAPHAAGNTAIHEVNALRLEFGRVTRVIGVTGIAAINDHVAGLKQLGKLVDGAVGRLSSRNHDPHQTWRLQGCHHFLKARHTAIRLGGAVEADHFMSCGRDALRHVAAHTSQTDHSQLHDVLLSLKNVCD